MHHDLDIHPIPEKVLYINDLSIADTAFGYETEKQHQKALTGKIHSDSLCSDCNFGFVALGLSALLEETARNIFPDIGFNSFCTGIAVFIFNIKPLNYAEGQDVSLQQPFRRTYKSMAKCIFKNLAYISNVILVHIEDIPIWSVLITSAPIFFGARYMFVYNLALPALFWILFSDGRAEKLTENIERVLQKEGK